MPIFNVILSVILLILNIRNNCRYNELYIKYAHEYATSEIFAQFIKQTKEYLSKDIILNCIVNAMKICENKKVITVHIEDGDYIKTAEKFYKEMGGDDEE